MGKGAGCRRNSKTYTVSSQSRRETQQKPACSIRVSSLTHFMTKTGLKSAVTCLSDPNMPYLAYVSEFLLVLVLLYFIYISVYKPASCSTLYKDRCTGRGCSMPELPPEHRGDPLTRCFSLRNRHCVSPKPTGGKGFAYFVCLGHSRGSGRNFRPILHPILLHCRMTHWSSCRASENHTTRVQELGRLSRYPATVCADMEPGCTISLTASTALAAEVANALSFAASSDAQEVTQASVMAAAMSKFKQAEDLAAYGLWMSQRVACQRDTCLLHLQTLVKGLNKELREVRHSCASYQHCAVVDHALARCLDAPTVQHRTIAIWSIIQYLLWKIAPPRSAVATLACGFWSSRLCRNGICRRMQASRAIYSRRMVGLMRYTRPFKVGGTVVQRRS